MRQRDTEKARKRMREIVADFQRYAVNYSEQSHYEDYSDTIYLDDMLYGIGLSLSGVIDYRGADGYERFKERLRQHLSGQKS